MINVEVKIEPRCWKISPGKRAILWNEFKSKNYISIGWDELVGDLREYSSKDELIKEFYEGYPNSYPDQLLQFYYEMKKGDKVLAYGNKYIYGLGEIVGDYYYKEEESAEYPYLFFHRRDVRWLIVPEPSLPIDVLPDDLQSKLMMPRTIVELTPSDWSTIEDALRRVPPEVASEVSAPEPSYFELLERQVRNYLAENPTLLEQGLQLVGKEYDTKEVGRMDILFKDVKGNYVVVETKKDMESDVVVGQILRYMGWVKEKMGQNVRGVIVAKASDVNLQYAVAAVRDAIRLKFYKVKFEILDG